MNEWSPVSIYHYCVMGMVYSMMILSLYFCLLFIRLVFGHCYKGESNVHMYILMVQSGESREQT